MELKYTDEQDKCFGLTGMAIAMVLWDADELLSKIDIDAPLDDALRFIPTYYFSGNPRVSAKTSWQHIFKHFQISMGMTIGNVMCRSHLLHSASPTSELRDGILELARLEGAQTCELDADEVQRLFTKAYTYLDKVFAHSGVQQIARQFADNLTANRTMTHAEVADALASLSRL